jgi:hypothetical protein
MRFKVSNLANVPHCIDILRVTFDMLKMPLILYHFLFQKVFHFLKADLKRTQMNFCASQVLVENILTNIKYYTRSWRIFVFAK